MHLFNWFSPSLSSGIWDGVHRFLVPICLLLKLTFNFPGMWCKCCLLLFTCCFCHLCYRNWEALPFYYLIALKSVVLWPNTFAVIKWLLHSFKGMHLYCIWFCVIWFEKSKAHLEIFSWGFCNWTLFYVKGKKMQHFSFFLAIHHILTFLDCL